MKRIFFLLLSIIFFTSCKDKHCPAFPEYLLMYFPYTKGNVLKFKNLNNDTLNLHINKTWMSDSYSFPWNAKCACGADAGFETDTSLNYNLGIRGSMHVSKNNFDINCYFYDSLHRKDNFYYYKEELDFYNEEAQSKLPDTINFEIQEFNRINNVMIIKKRGIVEFWDKEQNCTWKAIE